MQNQGAQAPPPYTTQAPPSQPYPAQQYAAAPPPGQYPQYPAPAQQYQSPPPGQYPAYPPPPVGQQGQQTVIVTQPAVSYITANGYGYTPVRVNCPHCHADVLTQVDHEVGSLAWLICGIIVLIGLFVFPFILLGCCFIPFCINDCKDVIHSCPSCRQVVSRVPRLE